MNLPIKIEENKDFEKYRKYLDQNWNSQFVLGFLETKINKDLDKVLNNIKENNNGE